MNKPKDKKSTDWFAESFLPAPLRAEYYRKKAYDEELAAALKAYEEAFEKATGKPLPRL